MNGHEQATQMLLENGSDINAQIETNRNTALTLACFQGRSEVAKLLIKCGANVDHRAKVFFKIFLQIPRFYNVCLKDWSYSTYGSGYRWLRGGNILHPIALIGKVEPKFVRSANCLSNLVRM